MIAIEDTVTHSHGPEGAHSHGDTAFTTWLDPNMARAQAETVLDALVARLPSAEAEMRAGFEALADDLDDLDRRLEQAALRLLNVPVLFSHPVYQYMIRAYSLNAESVHWEPDEMPPEADWQALATLHTTHPASLMVWEDEPLPVIRDRLEGMGIESAVWRPVGNKPNQGDYLAAMRDNIENLEVATAAK